MVHSIWSEPSCHHCHFLVRFSNWKFLGRDGRLNPKPRLAVWYVCIPICIKSADSKLHGVKRQGRVYILNYCNYIYILLYIWNWGFTDSLWCCNKANPFQQSLTMILQLGWPAWIMLRQGEVTLRVPASSTMLQIKALGTGKFGVSRYL